MKGSSFRTPFPLLARVGLASALAIVLLGTASPWLAAQSDNFNIAQRQRLAVFALPYYGAPTYFFPPDDTGGKAYRIYAPPTGNPDPCGLRNARAGSFRADACTSEVLSGSGLAGLERHLAPGCLGCFSTCRTLASERPMATPQPTRPDTGNYTSAGQ